MCRKMGNPGRGFSRPHTPKGHTQDPFTTNPARGQNPVQEEVQMLRVEIEYCAV